MAVTVKMLAILANIGAKASYHKKQSKDYKIIMESPETELRPIVRNRNSTPKRQ